MSPTIAIRRVFDLLKSAAGFPTKEDPTEPKTVGKCAIVTEITFSNERQIIIIKNSFRFKSKVYNLKLIYKVFSTSIKA